MSSVLLGQVSFKHVIWSRMFKLCRSMCFHKCHFLVELPNTNGNIIAGLLALVHT